jgi:hypothetical protein
MFKVVPLHTLILQVAKFCEAVDVLVKEPARQICVPGTKRALCKTLCDSSNKVEDEANTASSTCTRLDSQVCIIQHAAQRKKIASICLQVMLGSNGRAPRVEDDPSS